MQKREYTISGLENMILCGETLKALGELPECCADLIFTSPEPFQPGGKRVVFEEYEEYLDYMREVIRACKRVLQEGRFFVITASHILVPRAKRKEASVRIPVPFDLHRIFMEEGFAFVDDIIWQKPDGSSWMTGRGSRFSADRNPLQYKPQPVTEYLMVYRKSPEVLIDHFIRNHPDRSVVEASRIPDGYEKTNIWRIEQDKEEKFPQRFPLELASKVVQYYSFKQDVVLDPFAGIGITARAAANQERRFCMIEKSPAVAEYMADDLLLRGSNFIHPFTFTWKELETT